MQQLLKGFRVAGLLGPLLALMFLLDLSSDLISKILLTLAILFALVSVKIRSAIVPFLIFLSFAMLISYGFTLPALYYPVVVSFVVFLVFFSSLFQSRCLIQKIALRMEPDLPQHAIVYCFWVNIVWTVFMAGNTVVSYLTTADIKLWSLYNGLISYLLIGFLFVSEYGVRRYYRNVWGAEHIQNK